MTKKIPLTQGKFALVDDADFDAVARFKWCAAKRRTKRDNWYALRSAGGSNEYLHRFIMGASPGDEIDHINGDGLDNRRENLRPVTRSQNNINRTGVTNSTGHRGVQFYEKFGKYQARVWINQKSIRSGYFPTLAEAVAARAQLVALHYDVVPPT